jgi:two-component system, chemotaxis family, CheB/CheR fusion protein
MKAPDFPVVGIGASAGGVDAFHSFFRHVPVDCGMAFVILLHLPADRKSMLPEILARWTPLRVIEVQNQTSLEPNCIYVPPPHALVTVADGRLEVQLPEERNDKLFRPIDGFFDSLGSALRERAVGIVLSGTGSDGALGLKAIKERGGLTLAQGRDGSGPLYGEMPAGAIATGAVDLVLAVEEMPQHLSRLTAANDAPATVPDDANEVEAARQAICAILRRRLGHDFADYRTQTFMRRVERRRQMRNVASLQHYVECLQDDPEEAALLFRDLLIRVTSFFRDKRTFDALEAQVIPALYAQKRADAAVRVWVPGCATGEEAYSLAILLREYVDTLRGVPKVQIFATDIDDASIATARLGRYPATLLEGLAQSRRDRFFTLSQGSYVATKEIRDLCTFSTHNLVRDPPFSRMDLVSCRNLLIYMNSDLQRRVIPIFHYALVPDGILLLGGSESTAQHDNLFETLDKTARIFRRRPVPSPDLNLGLPRRLFDGAMPSTTFGPRAAQETPIANETSRGSPDARHAAAADRRIRAAAIENLLGPLPQDAATVEKLQGVIATLREELQSLIEEHQTALEELRSSNEELHSVNEEMQSTNEELETSKEELQSLNEELHTVNARLNEKIDELDRSNSDLRNLFDSTEVATIFLDRHLIIRSFTQSIATLYNLIPSDQGRPLTDIVSRLNYYGLREDVDYVLSTLEPLERRITRLDRSVHYIMRILPYRDPDSTVTGVLVTFVDVTSIVQAEAALVEADVRKDVFLATLSHELRNPLAPIRTAAQLLRSPHLPPAELMRAQAIITRQVTHMSSLLDDLLDVSRITRGTFLLKKEYVDVRVLLTEAVEAVQPAMDAKRHTLRVDYPAAAVALEVDPLRLTQVLSNLLTNAAKYTKPGGIISVGTRFEANSLAIFVRDNGAGLTPHMITKIFTMFTQIESDIGRTEGGLGIGLALAKGLVELHGGRIEVTSQGLGRGSEFSILLPRSLIVETPSAAPADAAAGAELGVPRRILIVDDNRDAAETLGMFLELSGHEIHLAHTATEALGLAARTRLDIGLLDIGLPDMSGYELAERIRHEAWGAGMTLVAITGWGQANDKRRALAAGFNHHLTKPIDPTHLEELFGPANKAPQNGAGT